MRRSRLVRIPHSEIDDVLAALPSLKLEGLHLREDIRRKSLDSIKPVAQPHEVPLTILVTSNFPPSRQKARELVEHIF
jgi:hypothetical protein